MKHFEEVLHTADWSFRAFGRDLSELFEIAARALFSLQGAIPRETAVGVKRDVQVAGIDYESLLVNWLNELLFMQEQHREVYVHFTISVSSPTELSAQIIGKPREKMDKIIKAVTYHNLKIEQIKDVWQVLVVVDV